MLNWDDPLAAALPASTGRAPAPRFFPSEDERETAPRRQPAEAAPAPTARPPVRPGQGIVDNPALMATAGAAPSVNPNPFSHQTELPIEDTSIPGPAAQTRTQTRRIAAQVERRSRCRAGRRRHGTRVAGNGRRTGARGR